ncbi:hypothetical protein D3C72_2026410 [compost metagenome]
MDPHGEPIPDKDGNVIQPDHKKLSKCKENQTVELASVTTSSEEFLNFLNKRDLSLGTKLKILQIEGFDQSMLIAYNGREENFSKTVCERLLVK